MIFRAIRESDRDAWVRMRRALWPDPEEAHEADAERFFAGRAALPEAVIVAAIDGELAGFVELSVRTYAEGCTTNRVGYLEGWYVEPYCRRQGVGRGLLAAAEEWARARGCTEFASDASPENAVSLAAHAACGFEKAGRVVCFRKDL